MARKNEASIKITAQNKLKAGLQDATNELGNFGKVVNNLGKLTIGAGIGAAIYKIGQAAANCTKNFMETEDAYLRMAKALSKEDYKHAIDSINTFSRMTKASRDEVATMISTLSSLGKSSEDIDKISTAAIALSNVTGKDLNSSMEIMLDSLNGSTGEIEKYLPQVKDLTEEEKKLGLAIDEVVNKFGNLSTEISGDSFSQTVKNIKDTMDSIGESIGAILKVQLEGVFEWIEERLIAIDNHIRTVKELTKGEADVKKWRENNSAAISHKLIIGSGFETFYNQVKQDGLIPALKVWSDTTLSIYGSLGEFKKAKGDSESAILLEFVKMIEDRQAQENKWKALDVIFGGRTPEERVKQEEEQKKKQDEAIEAEKKAAEEMAKAATELAKAVEERKWSADLAYRKNIAGNFQTGNDFSLDLFQNADTNFGGLLSLGLGNFSGMKLPGLKDIENNIKEAIRPLTSFIKFSDQDRLNELYSIRENLGKYLEDLVNLGQKDSALYKQTEKTLNGVKYEIGNLEKAARDNAKKRGKQNNLAEKIPEFWSKENIEGGMMSDLMNTFGELFGAVQPIIEMCQHPVWRMILEIAEGFVEVFSSALTQTIQPFFDSLRWIGESIANLFMPIFDSLYPYFTIIAQIIETAIEPCLELIAPLMEIVALILDAIRPILVAVAVAFEYLMSPVKWLADLFGWLGEWIAYAGKAIDTFVYNLAHPLRKRGYGEGPGEFSSDAFSGLEDRVARITELNAQDNAVSGSSTGTAIQSASYNGSMSVTINNNIYSPIVGEDGMDQFATMIKDKFVELEYFGV